jgi:putative acetyltransferase
MREDQLSPVAPGAGAAPAGTIWQAQSPEEMTQARTLFQEYARWLEVDLCFQGFDAELAGLPGAYAPPYGRLLLAGTHGAAFGCIALRPLDAVPLAPATAPRAGEVKRLFVRPGQRGQRWGRRLAEALMTEARSIGYRELKLDTLAHMAEAQSLYASLGFRPCAPYYHNPIAGTVYMAREL